MSRESVVLCHFLAHDCLVSDDVHVVVVVTLLLYHVVELIVRDLPILSHEYKQVDLL